MHLQLWLGALLTFEYLRVELKRQNAAAKRAAVELAAGMTPVHSLPHSKPCMTDVYIPYLFFLFLFSFFMRTCLLRSDDVQRWWGGGGGAGALLPFREPAHHPLESSVPGGLLFLLCIVVGLSNCELLYTQFKQVNLMMMMTMMMMMMMMMMTTTTTMMMMTMMMMVMIGRKCKSRYLINILIHKATQA